MTTNDSPTLTKAALRRSMKERLKSASDEQLRSWSAQLVRNLQSRADLWEPPGIVALFGGLRGEPDLVSQFLPWLHERGWRTALFAVSGTELSPVEIYSAADCIKGHLGVWEPAAHAPLTLAELNVILVPGLAFATRDGARLGRGGGFYDRLLSKTDLRAKLVGIAFQIQLTAEIPTEAHDIRVSDVVTER